MAQASSGKPARSVWKLLLKIFGGLFLTMFIAVSLIFSRMTFRTKDEDVEKYFAKRKLDVSIIHSEFNGRTLRWLQSGDTLSKKLIVFVHGAPGSSDNFHAYLADSALLLKANMVSIDRPGYGFSGYGKSETSIAAQAEFVDYVARQYPAADSIILVGHSYGGPIVAKCAVNHPEKIKSIMMLAPVNDPDTEPMFWFAKLTKWKLTRRILSGGLNVSGDEKLSHIAELRLMTGDWQQLRIPVTHIHGSKDWMAPRANIDFSRNHIDNKLLNAIEIPNTSHFIPWTNFEVVKTELLKSLGA